MILVDSLLYKIDMKLNKLASNTHQFIPLENKILALNEAQIKLIKQKLSVNNVYNIGLDGFKKRYEDLEVLIEQYKEHEIQEDGGKYSVDFKDNYMFYIDSYILADKGGCKSREINMRLVPHADVRLMMNNNHYKSSFEYQEALATISKFMLEIYTDGTFIPNKAYISYLRYPTKIDKSGYIDFEGKSSTDSNSELPDYLEDELVDLTVRELAMSTENVPAAEFSQQRIPTNE